MPNLYESPIPMSPFGQSNYTSVFWTPKPALAHTTKNKSLTYRPINDSAVRLSGNWIVRYPWVEVLTTEDVELKWQNYVSTIF